MDPLRIDQVIHVRIFISSMDKTKPFNLSLWWDVLIAGTLFNQEGSKINTQCNGLGWEIDDPTQHCRRVDYLTNKHFSFRCGIKQEIYGWSKLFTAQTTI